MSAHPIPAAALDDRLGFVGTAGSGKTYNAGTGVERVLAAGGRVIIPDPLGVWWGLGLCADGKTPAPWRAKGNLVIFGGEHGDMPLFEHSGALIGETVAGMAESAILDLSSIGTKAAEIRFMLAFLTALYKHASCEPVHLVFDEADMWAPQQEREKGEGPKLLGMMETVVRRGRVRGFIPWLISQRPAVLNKNVLSQVDGLVAFKLTSSQDRAALGAWIEGQADKEQGKAILGGLPTLPTGTGVVWLPSRDVLVTAAFPPKVTFDSSRTPTRGERVEKRKLKPLDLDKLKTRLSSIEEEAKANDPRQLKAEVARLQRELAAAQKAGPVAAPAWPDQREEVEAIRHDLERVMARENMLLNQVERIREVLRADDPNACRLTEKPTRVIRDGYLDDGETPAPVQRQPIAPREAPIRTKSVPKGDGTVPHGCAKPLAALAGVYPSGLTEPQWATAAGYKRSGGTWGTYKSRLSGAGLIEKRGDRFFATELGAGAVGDVEMPPQPGPDLVRWWTGKLHGTSKIAEALIEAWPAGLSKDELAARVDMAVSGGSFGTYLSRLAGPGLITRDGEIRLSDEVMGG